MFMFVFRSLKVQRIAVEEGRAIDDEGYLGNKGAEGFREFLKWRYGSVLNLAAPDRAFQVRSAFLRSGSHVESLYLYTYISICI